MSDPRILWTEHNGIHEARIMPTSGVPTTPRQHIVYYAHQRYGGGFAFSAPKDVTPEEIFSAARQAQRGVFYSTPTNQLDRIDRITILMTGETVWEREY